MDTADILTRICPVCGREEAAPAGRAGLLCRAVSRCGACGARFVAAGGGRYRLAACDPRAVARARRLVLASACGACVPCLVGRALTREEWARAAAALHGPPGPASFPGGAPTGAAGEVAIGVSEPVYREMGEPSYREPAGTLIVTNRRVVYTHGDRVWETPLADVRDVVPAPPGFRLELRSAPFPVHFFPPPGDPIAEVIRRAARAP